MVQLTGALRNLSRNKQFFKQFFQNNVVDANLHPN